MSFLINHIQTPTWYCNPYILFIQDLPKPKEQALVKKHDEMKICQYFSLSVGPDLLKMSLASCCASRTFPGAFLALLLTVIYHEFR